MTDSIYIEKSLRTGDWINSKKSQNGVVFQLNWNGVTKLLREAGMIRPDEYVDRLIASKDGLRLFLEDFDNEGYF